MCMYFALIFKVIDLLQTSVTCLLVISKDTIVCNNRSVRIKCNQKWILGCSSKTCNEAVRGDLGIETLQGRRNKAKLKWWYKLVTMPEDRYPKKLFSQDWNIKPHRGRQRKVWSRIINDLFVSLELDKAKWLKDIMDGSSSLKAFLALADNNDKQLYCIIIMIICSLHGWPNICTLSRQKAAPLYYSSTLNTHSLSNIGESISERESKRFEEGLNTKVKFTLYKTFGKAIEF